MMSTEENNSLKLGGSLNEKSAIVKNSQDGGSHKSGRSSNSVREMSHEGSLRSSRVSNASADDEPTDEDVYFGAKNYIPASELGESILLTPDITMFCQQCQRYIDISDLKEHGSYHEALRTFQYKDLTPANLGSLTSRRQTLIKEMFRSCKECLDPVWLRKIDEAYEIIRVELESNARRVYGVNIHDVCGFSLKCETMPCIKAIGTCSSLNKTWKTVMDEGQTFQNCFGGDSNKCFLGIYSGYNGPNAAETASRELHKFAESEIEKFEKCLHLENQQEEEEEANGFDDNKKEVGQDLTHFQEKQDIHDISNPQSIHSSLSSDGSDGSKVISENFKAIPGEEKNMKASVHEDGSSLLWNKHKKDSATYARKVSDAFVTAHHVVDEILSSGKGETSRVRWSGCSTLTCLIQSDDNKAAKEETFKNDDYDASKESESNKGNPNADRCSPKATLDTSDQRRESQQTHLNQRTHLATIHLANAGDVRAILVRRNKPTCLSVLHTPVNKKEHNRITKPGSTVNHRDFRVNGVLATTRGLGNHGDRLLKKYVINTPFTASIPVDNFCQFLILASKGVWQVLSEEEAAVLLLQMLPCQSIPPPSIISTTIEELLRGGGTQKNTDSFIADFEEGNSNSISFGSIPSKLTYTSKDLGKRTATYCLNEDLKYFRKRDSSTSEGKSFVSRNSTLDKTSTAYDGHVIVNSDRVSAAEQPQDNDSRVLECLKQHAPSGYSSLDKLGSNGHTNVLSESPTQSAEMITAEDEPLPLSRLMAERLVQAALMAGTKDNVTVMIVLFNDSIDLS